MPGDSGDHDAAAVVAADEALAGADAVAFAAGTGRVTAGTELGRGSIPRDDVASVLLAVLETLSSIGKTFELVSGDTPIEEAVREL